MLWRRQSLKIIGGGRKQRYSWCAMEDIVSQVGTTVSDFLFDPILHFTLLGAFAKGNEHSI